VKGTVTEASPPATAPVTRVIAANGHATVPRDDQRTGDGK